MKYRAWYTQESILAEIKAKEVFWLKMIILIVPLIFLTGCGVTTTDYRGTSEYYNLNKEGCEIPNMFPAIAKDLYIFNILPYKEFRSAAWGHQQNPNTVKGFIQGNNIWLHKGYSKNMYFHEAVAHPWDAFRGRSGHGECWTTVKPFGYDKAVIKLLEGIELP